MKNDNTKTIDNTFINFIRFLSEMVKVNETLNRISLIRIYKEIKYDFKESIFDVHTSVYPRNIKIMPINNILEYINNEIVKKIRDTTLEVLANRLCFEKSPQKLYEEIISSVQEKKNTLSKLLNEYEENINLEDILKFATDINCFSTKINNMYNLIIRFIAACTWTVQLEDPSSRPDSQWYVIKPMLVFLEALDALKEYGEEEQFNQSTLEIDFFEKPEEERYGLSSRSTFPLWIQSFMIKKSIESQEKMFIEKVVQGACTLLSLMLAQPKDETEKLIEEFIEEAFGEPNVNVRKEKAKNFLKRKMKKDEACKAYYFVDLLIDAASEFECGVDLKRYLKEGGLLETIISILILISLGCPTLGHALIKRTIKENEQNVRKFNIVDETTQKCRDQQECDLIMICPYYCDPSYNFIFIPVEVSISSLGRKKKQLDGYKDVLEGTYTPMFIVLKSIDTNDNSIYEQYLPMLGGYIELDNIGVYNVIIDLKRLTQLVRKTDSIVSIIIVFRLALAVLLAKYQNKFRIYTYEDEEELSLDAVNIMFRNSRLYIEKKTK